MIFEASEFNAARKTVNSDIKRRINQILWYVLECHNLMRIDQITFSLAEIKNSKIKPENKFRNFLVDNYMRKNTHFLNLLETDSISFDKDSEETFFQDNVERTDKIDIYIRDSALYGFGKYESYNVYLAIECKRIKIKSDTKEYITDIQNYVDRNHTSLRLPFEAQIAFIENEKLNHKIISDYVNSILKKSKSIITDSFLTPEKLHNSSDETYSSKHKKNFGNRDPFLIYHLLLDYSKVVIA